jgi:hypothetical protein
MRNLFFFLLLTAVPAVSQFNTTLNPATTAAFEKYRQGVEAKLDGNPRFVQLDANRIQIAPAREDGSIGVKDGIVHDWIAAAVIPGAKPEDLIQVLQDYSAYKKFYTPEVQDSRIVSHNGDKFHIYLKLMKTKVLTVVLNSEFDVEYKDLGNGRWGKVSRSTRIAEIDDGKELPQGQGKGFLWRLNAYWIIEPRPNGLYMECRSISLSRDVPFGFGMVIKPFISGVPRESLEDTMTNTVKALRSVVARRLAEENPTLAQREVQQRGQ